MRLSLSQTRNSKILIQARSVQGNTGHSRFQTGFQILSTLSTLHSSTFCIVLQHRDWPPRIAYARKSASTEDDIVELAMDKLAVNLGVVNSSGPY